jgi:HK97 family phage major capsid protein
MAKDISRQTEGVLLPAEVSAEIWQSTQEESAVMRLAQKMTLPGAGMAIPIISGDPQASWIGETDKIVVSKFSFGNKKIVGYKLGVIVPFSNEFRRDMDALYEAAADRLPKVLAQKYDATVFGPATGAPGADFDTLGSVTAVSISANTYDALVTADAAIATGGGIINGWAFSPQARKVLLTAKDTTGRPIFINNVQKDGAVPALLGVPTYQTKAVYLAGTPDQIGFAGDWGDARYGVVEDIKVSISDQASLTIEDEVINLWERDMFALKVTFAAGFRVKNAAEYVKLTA